MLKKMLFMALSSVSLMAMHSLELNINDLDLESSVKLDMGQFTNNVEPDTTFVGITYMNANENYSESNNGNKLTKLGNYVNLSFLIKQEVNNSGLSIGLGLKTVFSSIKNPDLGFFSAIPLGIESAYVIPFEKVVPIWIGFNIYYAPESLTFRNSRSYLEYRAEANIEIIERGTLYFGYRNIKTNYIINNVRYNNTYNESGFFGFKFAF